MKKSTLQYLLIIVFQFISYYSKAIDYYWVGGTGNWSDFQNHWSTTSGGIPNALSAPVAGDSVYFDAMSFSTPGEVVSGLDTVTVAKMDFSNVAFPPSLTGSRVSINEALILSPGMSWDSSLTLALLYSINQNGTLFTAGVTLGNVEIIDASANFRLLDPLLMKGEFSLLACFFNSNDLSITANSIMVHDFTIADFGSSIIHTKQWTYSLQFNVGEVDLDSTTIIMDNPGSYVAFYSEPAFDIKYGSVIVQSDASISGHSIPYLEIYKNADIGLKKVDTLVLSNPGFEVTLPLRLEIGGEIITNGIIGSKIGITGFETSIFKSTGTICIDNVTLKDVVAAGGAHFYAGANSVDSGGNVGWSFLPCNAPPVGYYWVGGTGKWSDLSHWANSSNGTVFHTVLPDTSSNIYIDQFSFSGITDSLIIDTIAQGYSFYIYPSSGFVLSQTAGNLDVEGSFFVDGGTVIDPNVVIYFDGDYATVLQTNGILLSDTVKFIGYQMMLLDDVSSSNYLEMVRERVSLMYHLISNDHTINCDNLHIESQVDLGNSTFNCETAYISTSYNFGIPFEKLDKATFNLTGLTNCNLTVKDLVKVGTITMKGDGTLSGNGEWIGKLAIEGNVTFIDSIITDTLFLNNPGDTLNMLSATVIKNNKLIVTNSYLQPVTLISPIPGAMIVQDSGEVCLHKVNLQNILTSGNAVFYADTNCIDLGGNTGWIFTPCSNVTNVWPGDADYDGYVTNNDILKIGIAFNETGTPRSGASIFYFGQPAADWPSNFSSAVNKKHADTNGDGVIDWDDTTAVSLNYEYNFAHPLRLSSSQGDGLLYVDVVSDSASLGDTVLLNFYLGTTVDPVDSIYGIAFSLYFDPLVIDSGYSTFDFTGSWMGTAGVDLIAFQKPLLSSGKIDFALTRNDHSNVSGSGFIGSCGIVIVDNIGARLTTPFYLDDVSAVNALEDYIPISVLDDTLEITNGIRSEIQQLLSVYPNPSVDMVRINSNELIRTVTFTDLSGNSISSINVNKFNPQIAINLNSGFYIMRITTDKGIVCRKVSVVKQW